MSSLTREEIRFFGIERERELFTDGERDVRRRQDSHRTRLRRLNNCDIFLAVALDGPDLTGDSAFRRSIQYPHVLGPDTEPMNCPALTRPAPDAGRQPEGGMPRVL